MAPVRIGGSFLSGRTLLGHVILVSPRTLQKSSCSFWVENQFSINVCCPMHFAQPALRRILGSQRQIAGRKTPSICCAADISFPSHVRGVSDWLFGWNKVNCVRSSRGPGRSVRSRQVRYIGDGQTINERAQIVNSVVQLY